MAVGAVPFSAEDVMSVFQGGLFSTSSARKALLRDMNQVSETTLAEQKVRYDANQQLTSQQVELDSRTRQFAAKNGGGSVSSVTSSVAPNGQLRPFQLGGVYAKA